MWFLTADRGYDLLRAWGSASCDMPQLAVSNSRQGYALFLGMGLLPLVISYSRQGVRFVTGMGFCILWYLAADREYDLLRA